MASSTLSSCCALLALSATFGIPSAAHADSIENFNVNLSFSDGDTATGTLSIDETTQSVSAVDLEVYLHGTTPVQALTSLPYNTEQDSGGSPGTNFASVGFKDGNYAVILALPEGNGTDLSSFVGGVCTLAGDAACGGSDAQVVDYGYFPPDGSFASSGDVTPAFGATPGTG